MKTVIIAFVVLIVGISSTPNPEQPLSNIVQERIVTSQIVRAIEAICESIREAGLDPLFIEKLHTDFTLPVPVLFNTDTYFKELSSKGLSNVLIHRMTYSVLTSRLNFEVEMPLIDFGIGAASTDTTVFGKKIDARASGKVEIKRIRVSGVVRVNVGVISGISVRSIQADFNLGEIKSGINLVIQGMNFSNEVNELIETAILDLLLEYKVSKMLEKIKVEIDELIGIFLMEYINARLSAA